MKLYYSEGGIEIYHGDCREILPHITADVLVTDPPYGMAYQSGWKESSCIANDNSTACRDWAIETWGGQTGARIWPMVRRPTGCYARTPDLGQRRLAGHGRLVAAVGTFHRGDLRDR